MKTKPSVLFGLLLVLVLAAYLDSPNSIINQRYAYTASEPVNAKLIDPIPSEYTTEVKEQLEKTDKEDGYIIETYREYEIYKDAHGKIIKTVPTDKEDTLKYWDYSTQ